MNIIIFSSNMSEVGGIQRLTATLANSFIKQNNNKICIINTGIKKGRDKFYIDERVENLYMDIAVKDLQGLNILQKLFNNIKIFYKIRKFYKNYTFGDEKNVVIALGHSQSCLLPFVIPKRKNIKIIGSQHNPITYNKIYSLIRKFSLKKLDKYILINKTMQDDILEHYNLSNTYVIENPNEMNAEISDLKNRVVLAVGRLTEQKQFDVLIDIWNMICRKNKEWKLKIIGEGPLRDKLLEKIKEYKLDDSIILQDFKENMSEEYKNADILVMTSKYEGFGLVLVEAQSCGLPTIAFDCPTGPRNIINDGKDGYLIKNNDLNEFSIKLNYLINNINLINKFSKNAIENAKRFDIDSITDKWIKLFNEI